MLCIALAVQFVCEIMDGCFVCRCVVYCVLCNFAVAVDILRYGPTPSEESTSHSTFSVLVICVWDFILSFVKLFDVAGKATKWLYLHAILLPCCL